MTPQETIRKAPKPGRKKKSLKKECEELWAEVIKARAGYKSELSGKPGKQIGGDSVLNAHHILGKPNHALRFSLDNGICITNGEHNFGVHHAGRSEEYRKRIIEVIGEVRWFKLQEMRFFPNSPNLQNQKLFFMQELKRFKESL